MSSSRKVSFLNANDYELSARLEFPPDGEVTAYAIFAHVFTGNKSLSATRHISRALTINGLAVLRFDFTGLGESEGDFADTNFSSNVEDLEAAAEFLKQNYEAPSIIVGHSLGGAASIFAASRIDSIKAVATIGAPSEPIHVKHLLEDELHIIKESGSALVDIGGREFMIKKHFLEDLNNKNMFKVLRNLKKPILVLHSPQDDIVEIKNAAEIYHAAYHPKSFVSLDGADHMLTNKNDAFYTGELVAHWAKRYIESETQKKERSDGAVVARINPEAVTTEIQAGRHSIIADSSEKLGGDDFGPSPYQLLCSAVASSTAMILRKAALDQNIPFDTITVKVYQANKYEKDLKKGDGLDFLDRQITLNGSFTEEQLASLKAASDLCPVAHSIAGSIKILTEIKVED